LGQNSGPFFEQRIVSFHRLRNVPGRLHSALISDMKAGIHPEYHQTDMVCACGAVYKTRSTRRDIRIGICAACHPFFTGEQKFVDTAGRVEKFTKRYGSTRATRAVKKA
jgi:large subunit ribosomal protein L31